MILAVKQIILQTKLNKHTKNVIINTVVNCTQLIVYVVFTFKFNIQQLENIQIGMYFVLYQKVENFSANYGCSAISNRKTSTAMHVLNNRLCTKHYEDKKFSTLVYRANISKIFQSSCVFVN